MILLLALACTGAPADKDTAAPDTAADTDTDTDTDIDTDTGLDPDTDTSPSTPVAIDGTVKLATLPGAKSRCRLVAWSGTTPGTDTIYGGSDITCPTEANVATAFSTTLDTSGGTSLYLQIAVNDPAVSTIVEAWAESNPYTVVADAVTGVVVDFTSP